MERWNKGKDKAEERLFRGRSAGIPPSMSRRVAPWENHGGISDCVPASARGVLTAQGEVEARPPLAPRAARLSTHLFQARSLLLASRHRPF